MKQYKHMRNFKTKLGRTAGVGAIVLMSVLPASASAATQNFDILDTKAQTGMLVSLTKNVGVVEPANEDNARALQGVISTNTTDITKQAGQVSIETGGKADTLVSTLNGDIKVGDHIATSPLAGVGTKLKDGGWTVGIAQASFDAKSADAVPATITASKGSKQQVFVGRIPVIVQVVYVGKKNVASTPTASPVPNRLQAIADALAGKRASIVGLVLSFILILTGVVIAAAIIINTVQGSFAAIARQPLSKALVLRLAIKSFVVALMIIAFMLAGAFLVLRLF